MRLEDLYENFGKASPEDQLAYMVEYRLRRAEDMDKPSTWPKVKKTSTKSPRAKAQPITEEEKTLMELLGLKKKDIISMRLLSTKEEDE